MKQQQQDCDAPTAQVELHPKAQFRVRLPSRTYYLEDAAGDVERAEVRGFDDC